MEELLETLYARESNQKDPSCKTCKNKPKLQESGIFWLGVWMAVMSLYGNIMLFKQIFNLIFG
jgi:hypothetical protein